MLVLHASPRVEASAPPPDAMGAGSYPQDPSEDWARTRAVRCARRSFVGTSNPAADAASKPSTAK